MSSPAGTAATSVPGTVAAPESPETPGTDWGGYFDALHAALAELDACVQAHETARFPDLVPPAAAVPAELADRCDQVLAMLDAVTGRAQTRRDELAEALRALPTRRTARARRSTTHLGSRVDIVG